MTGPGSVRPSTAARQKRNEYIFAYIIDAKAGVPWCQALANLHSTPRESCFLDLPAGTGGMACAPPRAAATHPGTLTPTASPLTVILRTKMNNLMYAIQ
jgi:hypothetical protein